MHHSNKPDDELRSELIKKGAQEPQRPARSSMTPPDTFDLIIYHRNCYDGMTAAWVARMHSPDAVLYPAQYGDIVPEVEGKRVLVVDFSYPREALEEMNRRAESVLVLDHHKTAAEDLDGLECAVFDMDRSGAGLAWDHLIGGDRHWLVDHVEDRDLWRFALDGTREVHAAMSCCPMDIESWPKIAMASLSDLIRQGRVVLGFTDNTVRKFARRASTIRLAGWEVWAVNVPVEFASETADVLKSREPHRPVLCWSFDGERGDIYCSLRSRPEGPDVSAIARKFGGGGHRNAAGFRRTASPLEFIP